MNKNWLWLVVIALVGFFIYNIVSSIQSRPQYKQHAYKAVYTFDRSEVTSMYNWVVFSYDKRDDLQKKLRLLPKCQFGRENEQLRADAGETVGAVGAEGHAPDLRIDGPPFGERDGSRRVFDGPRNGIQIRGLLDNRLWSQPFTASGELFSLLHLSGGRRDFKCRP